MDQLFKDYKEYGIGGLIAMFGVKLLDYLSKRGSNDCAKLLAGMDGLKGAIKEQTDAIKEQTEAIKELHIESKLNSQTLQRITSDVVNIRTRDVRGP